MASLETVEIERPEHNPFGNYGREAEIAGVRAPAPDVRIRCLAGRVAGAESRRPTARGASRHAPVRGGASAGQSGFGFLRPIVGVGRSIRSRSKPSSIHPSSRPSAPIEFFRSRLGKTPSTLQDTLFHTNSKTASAAVAHLPRTTKMFEAPTCNVLWITLSNV